jgi:hypothetical protein
MTEGVFVEEQGVEEVVPVSGKPGRHQWLESTESPAEVGTLCRPEVAVVHGRVCILA